MSPLTSLYISLYICFSGEPNKPFFYYTIFIVLAFGSRHIHSWFQGGYSSPEHHIHTKVSNGLRRNIFLYISFEQQRELSRSSSCRVLYANTNEATTLPRRLALDPSCSHYQSCLTHGASGLHGAKLRHSSACLSQACGLRVTCAKALGSESFHPSWKQHCREAK